MTLAHNTVIGNGGRGIYIEPVPPFNGAIIDGGHNRASGNLVEPQCTGVVCKP